MLGREAAEQATKSQEVDLSRLKGFHLRFVPKMRSSVTCNWCLRLHLDWVEWQKVSVPLQPKQLNMCAVLLRRKIKFVYSILKWLRTKILNENWWYRVAKKRPKLVWILNGSPERIYPELLFTWSPFKQSNAYRASLKVKLFPAPVGAETNTSLPDRHAYTVFFWYPVGFEASFGFRNQPHIEFNRKSCFVAHSLTIWSPRDIQDTSDWLKCSDPFLGC